MICRSGRPLATIGLESASSLTDPVTQSPASREHQGQAKIMIIRVATVTLTILATCGHARANVLFSCSGTLEGPGIRTERAHLLSVTVDSAGKTVTFGNAGAIPIQGDTTDDTITFGNATGPIFGILNAVTGALFVSTFEPVTTYRGVCKAVSKQLGHGYQLRTDRKQC